MQRIASVILVWTIVWFGSASARAADDSRQGGAKVPDAQMKAVLDELAALNPKPIETLSPEEARKQPTPADAVKKVLEKQNKPTDPEAVGNEDDKMIPGTKEEIPVRIYTLRARALFPCWCISTAAAS